MRSLYIFLTSALLVLILHRILWQIIPIVDYGGWSLRVVAMSQGDFTPFQVPFFANPDMAVVSLGAVSMMVGASPFGALVGSLVTLTAVGVASLITLLYLLRPASLWWIVAGVSLIANEAYIESTPHDIIAAIYILVCYILALYLYEKRPLNYWWFVGTGVSAGVVLATYLPMGILFLLPLFIFLARILSLRSLSLAFLSAIGGWLVFDPLWLIMPVVHAKMIVSQTVTHAAHFIPSSLPLADFFLVAPLPLLGLSLAVVYLLFFKKQPAPLPSSYLLLMVGVSLFVTLLLLSNSYKTFRSFHPLFFIWTVFLWLFMLDLVEQLSKRRDRISRFKAHVYTASFLASSCLLLFLIAVFKTKI